jgi:hypothetical protein
MGEKVQLKNKWLSYLSDAIEVELLATATPPVPTLKHAFLHSPIIPTA